jgi:polyphosphate kinase
MKPQYHLIISNGGDDVICIYQSERGDNFTDEQKEILTKKFGNYIVPHIHPLSIDCYYNLNIIDNFEELCSEY